jgi:integrase
VRGSLHKAETKQRPGAPKGEFTWRIILALGKDPETGKHKQRWITFVGTRKEAEKKLYELVGEVHHGEFIEPSKLTTGQYMDHWVATSIKPRRAAKTYSLYEGAIRNHLKPAFGNVLLRDLREAHVEQYYVDSASKALKAAVKKRLLRVNVASNASNIPSVKAGGDVLDNVWTGEEARRFLTKVQAVGSEQEAAFFALALDSGARKGELLGLQWKDLENNTLVVERQLVKGGNCVPTFVPPKNNGVRTIELSDQTVVLLQAHKRKQAEVKMKNRTTYKDYGLVFAQSWENMSSRNSQLGAPLSEMGINRRLTVLCKAAGVREITPHGLRHTCATLSLAAGVPPHVVQRRLGHKSIEITLSIYAHVLPSQQGDAAKRLAGLLHR